MKNTIESRSLQQARKNAGLSLQTVARLLITDVSNLSKYERGVRRPNTDILLGYHLLTETPLEKLMNGQLHHTKSFLRYQIERNLARLRAGVRSMKTDIVIALLTKQLERLRCLEDVTKQDNE